MSKKDYVAIAAVIQKEYSQAKGDEAGRAIQEIAYNLANVFSAGNERFNRAIFLAACGINN